MPAVVSASRPKSPVSEARRALSSAAGIGSAPSRRISARIRPSTCAAASLRVWVEADERPGSRARVEAAARAVGKAAADADLLVQPRAVAAAEHRIGDERLVEARIAARDADAGDRDRRLAGAGHVDHDHVVARRRRRRGGAVDRRGA